MNDRKTTKWIRFGIIWLCAILILTPLAVLAVHPQMLQNTQGEAPSASPTASAPASATPAPTTAATSSASPTPSAPAEETDLPADDTALSADDTALSEDQITAVIENGGAGDAAREYLEPPPGMEKQKDTLSILLVGVDRHGAGTEGRSDTMILAHLNLKAGTVKLVSFLRDMYVKIPGKNMNRLNAAHYYGGIALLKETLQTNFGVNIDGAVSVDFEAMAKIIDQLGGVSLTVTEKERGQLNNLVRDMTGSQDQLLEKAGDVHLTGIQALCYSRVRKIDSDFERVSRQHRVLEAMLARMKDSGPEKLLELFTENMDSITTDMTLKDLLALIPFAMNAQGAAFETMRVPVDNAFYDDVVRGMMVLMPNLKKNSQAIEAFLAE